MTGTVLKVIAVLIGGSVGTLLGHRLPARVQETVLHGLGLMVLAIGAIMASGTENVLIPFSVSWPEASSAGCSALTTV